MLRCLQKFKALGSAANVPRTLRKCFSDFEDVDIIEEPPVEEPPTHTLVKRDFKYQFMKRSFAFVVDQPLFMYKPYTLYIGPRKMKFIKSFLLPNGNLFATAILPRTLDVPLVEQAENLIHQPLGNGPESVSVEPSVQDALHAELGADASKLFFDIGSYCLVDIVDDTRLSFRYLHKARVSNITALKLEDSEGEDSSQKFKNFFHDADAISNAASLKQMINPQGITSGVDSAKIDVHPDETVETPNKESKPEISTEQSSKPEKDKRSQKGVSQPKPIRRLKIEVPEDLLHLSDNHFIPPFTYEQLSIETRTKIDYLFDYAHKIMFQGSQEKILYKNYKDLDSLFDAIGVFLKDLNFFKYEEIVQFFMSTNVDQTVDIALNLMRRYLIFLTKMQDVGKIAEQNIQLRRNREYYNEVYNIIKRMAESQKENPLSRLQSEFASKNPPLHVREVFNENLKRLSTLDKNHPEYAIQKNYMEWLVSLPFGVRTNDTFDLDKAKEVLNESHYGLEEVKKRILEFIAVGKLTGNLKGKILCFEGPPGVGKTSFAFSVAKALNRKVYRLSLGGESDVSVLKGHRKTYIGARPGKIVTGLKECQAENCVIIIDEIDKIGKSNFLGDPQSTLLEVLDPEQNNAFTDNFLDFPIDLSSVLFICTANNVGYISPPLLDRMDVIHISSYTNFEKKHIFHKFLFPKALEDSGLQARIAQFTIHENVIDKLLLNYSREAGIRSLQKYTNRLLEKIAYKILEHEENSQNEIIINAESQAPGQDIVVTAENLSKYIGQPVFDRELIYDEHVPGVVKGLAYNEVGGSVLFLEASVGSLRRYAKGIKFTGSLGDVMKESVKIAYSFARKFLKALNNPFLEEYNVHIHVPEGATPKDGPSAGIAITSALISLALKLPLKDNIAMTGEISLKGKVLKIGGLKEKILAAKREKVFRIIVPAENAEDVEFLDKEVTEGVSIKFVERYAEVFDEIFEKPQ